MDVKTLSAIIGHVSAKTTLNIYTHITNEMQENAAASIDRGIAKAEISRQKAEAASEAQRFEPYTPPRRRPGTGYIKQLKEDLWEGRYSPVWPDGKKHSRNVYGRTREECEEKLAKLILQMKAEIAVLRNGTAAEYDDLMRQKEPVAHEIALALELFTTGSLNVFAHQTNIDTRNRIICYDIQDLGENLKPIGLLVMLDSILNRVIRNRQQGRYTHVYIDEIYLFFASPGVGGKSAINNYSSEFLYKCWKRFRKYYATLTGITQNVEECLLSDTARLMFANSEFLVLLNQAPTDRAELAKLLDASDAQMDYVSDAPAGHGLIKVGSCLVPFINELPRDTELYRLMTTKPGEQNA